MDRVEGELGNFTVTLHQRPRYIDTNKCIACGECARKCPKEVKDEYNEGISERRAVYVKYPQAVPLKYQIDPEHCIKIQKDKCGACAKVCPAGAINFEDKEKELTIEVGSIILAPGFKAFDPRGIRTWGYGMFPNVVTALQFERYLSMSGPTEGHLIRPSDGRDVKKIAFLQCVGSRDVNKTSHGYCSNVCCMFALKEALIAMDHVKDLAVHIFYMDMRTHGKDFERYYERAKQRGVHFHRCRVHSLEPVTSDGDVYFRYISDDGKQVEDKFDLVVLSTGMETPQSSIELAERVGIELNENNFASTSSLMPVSGTRPGIYVCGAFSGPKDIPLSVIEASAAAAVASIPLANARYSQYRQVEFPPERDVKHEEPRVGVFICHCGSNIAGVIDIEAVAEYARGIPGVEYVEHSLFTCSQDTQDIMRECIQKNRLNRIVVAACTPRTHEPLFKETLKNAGINEYLFEMANIRNQGSWVHQSEPEAATEKAKDLVRMAVAKVCLLEPLPPVTVNVNPQALVIGGGLAGMVSALGLADQGFPVHLVEKSSQLGGNALHLGKTWRGETIQGFLHGLISRIRSHELITVHLKGTVTEAEGFVGNFRSKIVKPTCSSVVEHGVAILALGGQAFKPSNMDTAARRGF